MGWIMTLTLLIICENPQANPLPHHISWQLKYVSRPHHRHKNRLKIFSRAAHTGFGVASSYATPFRDSTMGFDHAAAVLS